MPCDVCPCPAIGLESCPWESGIHRHAHTHVCEAIRGGSKAWIQGTLREAVRDLRKEVAKSAMQTILDAEAASNPVPAPASADDEAREPHVAPLGARPRAASHEGIGEPRPWGWPLTVTIPHLDTPDILELGVELLRMQTTRPYIIIVDTGSTRANLRRIESLRGADCEIHHIRSGGYRSSSDPVAIACDLAQMRCQTEYLYYTHADCFIRRRDWLEHLLTLCSAAAPVVGYQLTDREFATKEWRWMVGHTATIVHVPTMRRANCWWSMAWMEDTGVRPETETYWDTEVGFCWALRRAGITPTLIGTEQNYQRNVDENIDHVRSYSSHRIYTVGHEDYRLNIAAWVEAAMREARGRIDYWRHEDTQHAAKSSDLAVVMSLTDEQSRTIDTCRHKTQVDACCGSYTACAAHGGRKVGTVDCARCVTAGGPPAQA